MLADQIASEIRTKVTANGRSSDQWRMKPNRDNHFLDCLSMASIAASIRGMKLDDQAISRAIKSVQESTENAQKPPEPAPKPAPQAPQRRPNRQGSWLSGFGFGGAQ
jgi:phage terminase large subunit GpA-like protein